MKTKIIVGAVITAMVATSLFAAGRYCDNTDNTMGYGMGPQHNQGKYMQDYNRGPQHMRSQSGFGMMGMFQVLNLTEEQQVKVEAIIKKHMNIRTNMSEVFTKSGFDKEKFIKYSSEKRDNMIKSRADMIEAIYGILNDEQKLQFKVLFDLKMHHMSQRVNSDKHSYGRG